MFEKVITVQPYGGLGNRLLTLSSLYRIGKILDADLLVKWLPMPTVIHESIEKYYSVPFAVSPSTNFEEEALFSPTSWNGRFYIAEATTSAGAFHIDFGPRWHHCLWLESDLQNFGDTTPLDLTAEIRKSLHEILVPSSHFASILPQSFDTFDLGIHVRTALPDDFKQGPAAYSVWPQLEHQNLLTAILSLTQALQVKVCFLATPNIETETYLVDELSLHGVTCLTSNQLLNNKILTHDELLHLDFYFLSRSRNILRRTVSTFAAVAGIVGSSKHFVFSDDYAIREHPGLLFTGYGL